MGDTPREAPYQRPFRYRIFQFRNPASNALEKKAPFDPPGLTIVAPIRRDERAPIERLIGRFTAIGLNFVGFTDKPHVTLHGVLARNQPALTAEQRHEVVSVCRAAMADVFAGVPPFRLTMELVAEGGNRHHPVPDIVWLALSDGSQTIRRCSEQLHSLLRERLPHLADHLGKPVGAAAGIKITLGYFDRDRDFPVGDDLARLLAEVHDCRYDFLIDTIELCEFTAKSLADATALSVVPLAGDAPSPVKRPLRKLVPAHAWADFRGLSYLMVNPGDSHRDSGRGVAEVCCAVWQDSRLPLYRALGDALADVGLDRDDNPFGLARLPSTSWHVTAFDVVADDSLPTIHEPFRSTLATLFQALPDSAAGVPADVIAPAAFDDVVSGERPIAFEFAYLKNRANALVAVLKPAAGHEAQFEALQRRRRELDERCAAWGREPGGALEPHVSLGYYVNDDGAVRAAATLDEWNRVFSTAADGTSVTFERIRPYFFRSMATFVCDATSLINRTTGPRSE